MKAKLRGTTGAYFDVVEVSAILVKDSIPFVQYYADDEGTIYDDAVLEFLPEESKEVTIEGWVLRDDNNKIGIYRDKPTCDEDGWDLTGERYELFPDITSVTEPKRYRITITPIEE